MVQSPWLMAKFHKIVEQELAVETENSRSLNISSSF